jgi:ribosomal protein S6
MGQGLDEARFIESLSRLFFHGMLGPLLVDSSITMTEQTMPAAEATIERDQEVNSYELAFHILPTVAEGEVSTVFATIKKILTDAGATLGSEEAPERFVLAYTIEKRIDDKIRRFDSAYFGWLRFTLVPDVVNEAMEDIDSLPETLRTLLIKLTKAEEETPFFFHEALQKEKKVVEISEEELASIAKEAEAEKTEEDAKESESATIEDEEKA